jgi:hypothetical protein
LTQKLVCVRYRVFHPLNGFAEMSNFAFERIQERHNPLLGTCCAVLGLHTSILEHGNAQSRKISLPGFAARSGLEK